MLPLALLHAAAGKPMLVELKSGETFNGHLIACDNFMNLTLKEAYQTSADGEKFWKLDECYVRGSNIKYIRVAESLVETVKQQEAEQAEQRQRNAQRTGGHQQGGRGGGGGARGGRGGPGAGRGRGGDRGGRGGGGDRGGRGGAAGRGGKSRPF